MQVQVGSRSHGNARLGLMHVSYRHPDEQRGTAGIRQKGAVGCRSRSSADSAVGTTIPCKVAWSRVQRVRRRWAGCASAVMRAEVGSRDIPVIHHSGVVLRSQDGDRIVRAGGRGQPDKGLGHASRTLAADRPGAGNRARGGGAHLCSRPPWRPPSPDRDLLNRPPRQALPPNISQSAKPWKASFRSVTWVICFRNCGSAVDIEWPVSR